MEQKGTYKVQKSSLVLLADQHYFNYVFKKTEKIVCAVFYILQNHKDIKGHQNDTVLQIKDAGKRTLDLTTATLSKEAHEARADFIDITTALVALESHVRIGASLGLFSEEITDVLCAEIEGVTRSVARYTEGDVLAFALGSHSREQAPLGYSGYAQRSTQTHNRNMASGQARGETTMGTAGTRQPKNEKRHTSRQDQILEVIGIKKTVSIKDISEDIKDCSEKTIQRELNNMIENGLIKREGERRWSRYSLL